MFRKVSVIGHPIGLFDLFAGAFLKDPEAMFSKNLKQMFSAGHIFFTNTGIASFYLALLSFKKLSDNKEVFLPCYTAPSLVVAVLKAGLKPVLYDISLEDFNADVDDLMRRAQDNSLCAVVVHMFGIPCACVSDLKKRLPIGVYVVEDCAQAFGAKVNDRYVGTFGDISFFSFNRGKNLPTYEGGCAVTNSDALAKTFKNEWERLEEPDLASRLRLWIKLSAFALVSRPFFYGLLHSLIECFKDNSVPTDLTSLRYAPFQMGIGEALLKESWPLFEKRRANGLFLLDALAKVDGLLLPKITQAMSPVFNRLPVLVKDAPRLKELIDRLDREGIESSRLYWKPLHHIFDLGYKADDFPNATYLAERLLTLPTHPYVTRRDLETMVRIIRETINN